MEQFLEWIIHAPTWQIVGAMLIALCIGAWIMYRIIHPKPRKGYYNLRQKYNKRYL